MEKIKRCSDDSPWCDDHLRCIRRLGPGFALTGDGETFPGGEDCHGAMTDGRQEIGKILKELGKDGLCCESCGCATDDLMPCCEPENFSACKPGMKVVHHSGPDGWGIYENGD